MIKTAANQPTVTYLLMQVSWHDLHHVDPAQSACSKKIEQAIRQLTPETLPHDLHLLITLASDEATPLTEAAGWAVFRATSRQGKVSSYIAPDGKLETLQQIKLEPPDNPDAKEVVLVVTTDTASILATTGQDSVELKPYDVIELTQ